MQHDAMKFTYKTKLQDTGLKEMLTELMSEVKRGGESPEDAAKLVLDLLSDGTLCVMPRFATKGLLNAMLDWPYASGITLPAASDGIRYDLAVASVHGK